MVLADVPGSVAVDNTTCLDEMAKKVDHIDVVVRDLEADPVFTGPITAGQACTSPKATVHFGEPVCGPRNLKSIVVHGTVHKQIYYVNREDNVRHMGEDIHFTKTIDLSPPLPVDNPGNVDIDFKDVDVDVSFELPRPTRINQVATVTFTLKITQDQQIFIQTCVPTEQLIGQQVLANTGFEAFAGNVLDVWSASNIVTGQPGRNGGFSVGLGGPAFVNNTPTGASPTNTASLVQQIPMTDLRPGLCYQLCLWLEEVIPTGATANYTVEARVVFRDATGAPINSAASITLTSDQINTTWVQRCVTSNPAPENVVSGSVEIVFTPGSNNGAYVLVDDATLTITSC